LPRTAGDSKKVQDNLRDGLPFPYTEKDGAEFIAAMQSADANDNFAFAVTLDDEAVGSIGVFRQSNIHRRTGELGYYIAEKHWGKGHMTEAVRQICRHVFENTDIIRIFAEPFANNEASCRVLGKAGFQYEGTLRANAVKNGEILDMKMYARVRTD
jgi:RimJ/RimL family protein N-acetyltransferase